ncbi:peptidase family M3-domain-containing protein [Pisolithus sp. B1]|nr:peptidase family M3-domain-containing protein [Pisolithus sp. B1]
MVRRGTESKGSRPRSIPALFGFSVAGPFYYNKFHPPEVIGLEHTCYNSTQFATRQFSYTNPYVNVQVAPVLLVFKATEHHLNGSRSTIVVMRMVQNKAEYTGYQVIRARLATLLRLLCVCANIVGGYEAGYYRYTYSLVFAAEMYRTVFKRGPLDPILGQLYHSKILLSGGSRDEMVSLEDFLCRPPNSDAFLGDIFGLSQSSADTNL